MGRGRKTSFARKQRRKEGRDQKFDERKMTKVTRRRLSPGESFSIEAADEHIVIDLLTMLNKIGMFLFLFDSSLK